MDDFCSVCGTKMTGSGAAPAAATPAATSPTCSNCGEPHKPEDVFCESCGYDFLAGSLPDVERAPTSSGAAAAAAAAGVDPNAPPDHVPITTPSKRAGSKPVVAHTVATLEVSHEFFDRMAAGGAVDFPDPIPPKVTVELKSDNVLVGRLSESRNVYPEIDVTELQDPAASTRHCLLRRTKEGSWTVTDVGSTNGTYLDDGEDPLAPDTETALGETSVLYVGAWTKITLSTLP